MGKRPESQLVRQVVAEAVRRRSNRGGRHRRGDMAELLIQAAPAIFAAIAEGKAVYWQDFADVAAERFDIRAENGKPYSRKAVSNKWNELLKQGHIKAPTTNPMPVGATQPGIPLNRSPLFPSPGLEQSQGPDRPVPPPPQPVIRGQRADTSAIMRTISVPASLRGGGSKGTEELPEPKGPASKSNVTREEK
jgi:hypothetical protein